MSDKLATTILLLSLLVLLLFTLGGCAGNSSSVARRESVADDEKTPVSASPTPVPAPEREGEMAEGKEAPTLIEEEGMISYYEIKLEDSTLMQYGLVLPDDFDATERYPILLALPPGGQNKASFQSRKRSVYTFLAAKWLRN
ncbi:MAG: hypothetical protein ACPGWR_13185 [Ardenticatenaceae bacterium]